MSKPAHAGHFMRTYKALLKIFADIKSNDAPKETLRPHHNSQKDAHATATPDARASTPAPPPTAPKAAPVTPAVPWQCQ